MDQLVGADRNGVGDVLQDLVLRSRQRLLDQLDTGFSRGLEQALQHFGPPGLVRIGDQPRGRRGLAHGGEAHRIAVAPELELEQGIGACFARALRHRFGRSERNRQGREHGLERIEPRQIGSAPARPLRLEIPQGAIERIARGPRRQLFEKRGPAQAVCHALRASLDCCDRRPRRSRRSARKARIRRARYGRRRSIGGDDHRRFVLDPAGNGKAAADRPAFDRDRKAQDRFRAAEPRQAQALARLPP